MALIISMSDTNARSLNFFARNRVPLSPFFATQATWPMQKQMIEDLVEREVLPRVSEALGPSLEATMGQLELGETCPFELTSVRAVRRVTHDSRVMRSGNPQRPPSLCLDLVCGFRVDLSKAKITTKIWARVFGTRVLVLSYL